MQGKERKPEIRFGGFTDEWGVCNLKDIADRVIRKNSNNNSRLPLTISAQEGLVDQITYFNNRVASRDVSNYYLIVNGEFAYNKSTSDGYPFGAVKRLDKYDKGVLSTLYIVFRIKDKTVNSDYLTVFFDTDRWYKDVAERAAEGARNHGLLNISAEDFLDISLLIPKDFDEQANVGTFFKQIDNFINLQQNKYNQLVNMKQTLLERMFPHDGAKVPEIRFDGFEGDWTEKKLGGISNLLTGYPFESKYFSSSGTRLIRGMNVKRGYLDMSSDLCEYWPTNLGLDEYLLQQGDIVIQMDGAMIGRSYAMINYDDLPALLVQRVTRVRSDKKLSAYLYYCIQKGFLNYILGLKTETAVPHLSLKDIANYTIKIPRDEKEAVCIGNFFKQIDKEITCQQQKIEQLQSIKQSFLDKMFVS